MSNNDFLIYYGVLKSYEGRGGDVVIPESVRSIDNSVFEGCTTIKSVVIPSTVTSIGNRAFCSCTSLERIVIGDSVESIGESAFSGCTELKSVSIGNSVKTIGRCAFYGCSSLGNVSIPDSVISVFDSAFSGCSLLQSVTIGNSVTEIGECSFSKCTMLTRVTIGDSVKKIGAWAFWLCTSLESISIGKSVEIVGNKAFYGCSSLVNVMLPNSVKEIGDHAFWRCISLNEINIPESVSLIGSGAFRNCKMLSRVIIPTSVSSIGQDAFSGCINAIVFLHKKNKGKFDDIFSSCKKTIYLDSIHIPRSKNNEPKNNSSIIEENRSVSLEHVNKQNKEKNNDYVERESSKTSATIRSSGSNKYLFISYKSEEKDCADEIRTILSENNVKTWMAPDDIPGGSEYGAVINRAIKNSSGMILLLSEMAQKSLHIMREFDLASNRGKTIIPVHIDDSELNDSFEYRLLTIQIVEVNEINRLDKGIIKLLAAAKALVE